MFEYQSLCMCVFVCKFAGTPNKPTSNNMPVSTLIEASARQASIASISAMTLDDDETLDEDETLEEDTTLRSRQNASENKKDFSSDGEQSKTPVYPFSF